MLPALATLIAGAAVGYLGQRARFCLVAAWRDYLLVRDTRLLAGLGVLLLVAAVFYPVAALAGGDLPGYPAVPRSPSALELGYIYISCQPPSLEEQAAMEATKRTSELFWVFLALGGGFGLGLFSTLANGCPFRQHVLAASGDRTSWWYLLGFYGAGVMMGLVSRGLGLPGW